MAISPNDNFTAGQVLTFTECNQWPRGIVARAESTTTDATITAEEIQLTSGSFTAVANRYYRITYYEPQLNPPATSGTYITSAIRLTNLAGTKYQAGIVQNAAALAMNYTLTTNWVGTLTAGSTVIVATLLCSSGTGTATRVSTMPAQLIIEDIGPA